jgi:two-component system, NarL family, response regulator DevR
MTLPIKLFVIDDHDEVRKALIIRLCAAPGVLIVGEANAMEAALEEVNVLRPDVVLMEIKRADGRGLELVSRLAQGDSGSQVIALTSYPNEWERWAVHHAGAVGYFLKDIGSTHLLLEQIRKAVVFNQMVFERNA